MEMRYVDEIVTSFTKPENIYVFDLDGTLADLTHRVHHILKKPKDWDSFFYGCGGDEPIKEIIDLTKVLSHNGEIWILTGRNAKTAKETIQWLESNNVKYSRLFMRKNESRDHDTVIKKDWLMSLDSATRSKIRFVVEDRKGVVDMWRSEGIVCLQPRDGDF